MRCCGSSASTRTPGSGHPGSGPATSRLKWWPDFDHLPATADQVRIVKASVKGLMTVDKLATVAKCDLGDAYSVINALSLMGALRRVEGKGGTPTQPMPEGKYDFPDRQRGGRHVKRGS